MKKKNNPQPAGSGRYFWLRIQVLIRRTCRNLSYKEGRISLTYRKAAYIFLLIPPVLFNLWLLFDGGKATKEEQFPNVREFRVPGLHIVPIPRLDSIQNHLQPQNKNNYEKAIDEYKDVKKD